jgi:medium-chain acyl-[acyl-carrier-protein] hydrolase
VEVLPVQLPGRGPRLREEPLRSVPAIVGGIASALGEEFHGSYALLGYSLGALLAFELARVVLRERVVPPRILIVASLPAPQGPEHAAPLRIRDAEILENLGLFGGLPPELRTDPEILSHLLPIIRADLRAVESYTYRPGPPLPIPITAIGGMDDLMVNDDHLRAWADQTTDRFHVVRVPGGHFFLHTNPAPMFAVLRDELAPLMAG